MSIRFSITLGGMTSAELADLAARVEDAEGLHARIAGEAENFIKDHGRIKSAKEHDTARGLGASPTGHLAEAYEGIESDSSAAGASLWFPGAGRLARGFGGAVIRPVNSKYLTIPVHKDAYGKRARELDDLFPMRVGPKKQLVLARRVEGEENQLLRARTNQRRNKRRFATTEIMYVLATEVYQPPDFSLIPFDDLREMSTNVGEMWMDEQISEFNS
jgi:hypothetical protein